ncbi:uncharacterized protein [Littorina saxatilis]|uniref:uncharacterized protein n=1 Tax=Littorina saxatilis TaxID=31220 RepID=UPI0038B4AC26
MAETIQEAKKMTSREASSVEESTTSDSTLDNDVTMKDEGYPFHKGRQQPRKSRRSGVVHMGGGIQNQKQCGQLSPWSPSSSSSGKSGGSGVVHMSGGIHDEGGQKHGQLSFGSLSSILGYRCGQVQHDVLQSPDHNTVHVIYGHTSGHFVHSELTEELKTRTGLQLVPPQSHVATSSFTADSVLIVIVDSHYSVTDRFLREAVETSGHPDTHTLFIHKGYYRSGWVEENLPRCTVMVYPGPEMDHSLYVLPRQSSVSAGAFTGPKDVRTLFWDNVSTMIGTLIRFVSIIGE